MCGLFAGIIFLYMRKEKEREIVELKASQQAEERERERIANIFHDDFIPLLSVIVRNVDSNKIDYENNMFKIENLDMDKEVALQLTQGIKALALELIPKVLLDKGFVKALSNYIKTVDEAEFTVTLLNKTPFETETPLDRHDEINLYRICIEVLTNLIKHDRFTFIEVVLNSNLTHLNISFIHDGKGISNREIEAQVDTSTGLGLKSLKSRLTTLNGSIDYFIGQKRSKISINIPFAND